MTMATNQELLDVLVKIRDGLVGPVVCVSRTDFMRVADAAMVLLASDAPTGELRRALSIMLENIVKHATTMDEKSANPEICLTCQQPIDPKWGFTRFSDGMICGDCLTPETGKRATTD